MTALPQVPGPSRPQRSLPMRFPFNLFRAGSASRAGLWQAGIYLSFWAEVRLFTDLRHAYGPYWNPVLFYTASLLLCGFAFGYWLDRPVAAAPASGRTVRRLPLAWIGMLLGAVQVLYVQAPVIASHPVDVRSSDIIPILQAYVGRFRSGEVVYRYLTTLPYPLFPNHLPLQWLPYVPADQLGIDYRWWALGILLLVGLGAYHLLLARQPLTLVGFLLKMALPGYMLYRLITRDGELYANSVEPTIIAYYCLLAACVLSRSALLQGAVLVLCLLSRYSVLFWVPFYLWVLWREAGRRHAVVVAAVVLAGLVGIYVVPFLSKDWTIFTHALSEYRIATLGEWSRGDEPPQLYGGLGFAAWFHTYVSGDIAARISVLQRVHALVSVGAVGLMAVLYYRFRGRYNYRVFALIGLKFYLATFYAFIQIPYPYLTSLGLFISLFVVLITGTGQATTLPAAPAARAAPPANTPSPVAG